MEAVGPGRCEYPPTAGFCPRPATREFVDASGRRLHVCEKHLGDLEAGPTPTPSSTAKRRFARRRREPKPERASAPGSEPAGALAQEPAPEPGSEPAEALAPEPVSDRETGTDPRASTAPDGDTADDTASDGPELPPPPAIL
jgi:hypothetical protein